jgi:hypothetical protein
MEGLIKSPEQIQAEQQAMQEQMMMQQNSPAVVKEGMGIVRDSFKDQRNKNNKEN